MCGRVVQISDPIRLSIVDGLGVRDSRLSNYRAVEWGSERAGDEIERLRGMNLVMFWLIVAMNAVVIGLLLIGYRTF